MVQSCLGECNQAPLFVLAVRCVTSGGQGGERYFRWRFPENKFTVDFQVKVCVPGVGEGREKQESFYFFFVVVSATQAVSQIHLRFTLVKG